MAYLIMRKSLRVNNIKRKEKYHMNAVKTVDNGGKRFLNSVKYPTAVVKAVSIPKGRSSTVGRNENIAFRKFPKNVNK